MSTAPMNERLAQTVEIETPELVMLSYAVAGIGSRVAAALIDLLINILLFLAVVVVAGFVIGATRSGAPAPRGPIRPTTAGAWALAALGLVQFAILWGYYLLFEGLRDGQTPGKRLFRLRAVRDGGYSVGFSASAVRNLMRIVDMQPLFTYLIGIGSVAISRSGKRLGDIVAGTIVVREALVRRPEPATESEAAASGERVAAAQLTDEEFHLVARWSERRGELDPERRRHLVAQVANRVRHALPADSGSSDSALLLRLLASERRARERGAPSRGATGASRDRYAIVTTRSPRWIAFASRLADAQRRGLRALGENGVREFV